MDKKQIESWMKLFQKVSEYHWRLNMEPAWKRYGGGKRPWQSAALFLSTYAFERAGASPNYAPVAADVIKQYKEEFDAGIEKDTMLEQKIWGRVQEIMESRDELNPKRHPLASGQKKPSLIRLMQEKRVVNLVDRVKTDLEKNLEEKGTKKAFDFLTSVCGIGEKVASFFLCSVKEYFKNELPELPKETRNYFQPVDIWIRRIFAGLNNHPKPYYPDYKISKDQIASFIVEHSENPERVNMGMWYFGAMVCGKGWYRFEQVLKDLKTARKEWQQHCDRLKRVCCTHS